MGIPTNVSFINNNKYKLNNMQAESNCPFLRTKQAGLRSALSYIIHVHQDSHT